MRSPDESKLPSVLTPRELGDYLRVSDNKIRTMALRGEIPGAFRVDKQWRIPRTALGTLTRPWHGSPQKSACTPDQTDDTAFDGENTDSTVKNADIPKNRRKNAPRRSASDFDRDFPDIAKKLRSENY